MKRTLFCLAVFVSLNVYGQNGQQKLYIPQVYFDKDRIVEQMKPGSSSITGEAYCNDPMGNGTSYARNSVVYLIPHSEYFAEWQALVNKYAKSGHQVYLHPDVISTGRQVTTDEYGNFRFDKLKPGKYYLETVVDYLTSELVTTHSHDLISSGPLGVTVTPGYDYHTRRYTAQKKAATVVEIADSGQNIEVKLKPEANIGFLAMFRIQSSPSSTQCYRLRNRLYGTCKQFDAKGNLQELANWEKDLLDGDYKAYDPEGNVTAEGKFEQGKYVGDWLYYENKSKSPTKKERYKYQGDKPVLHGDVEFYYPDGSLREVNRYVDGVLSGESVSYHLNGKVWHRSTYRNGKLHGPVAELDEQGNVKQQGQFEMGKAVTR